MGHGLLVCHLRLHEWSEQDELLDRSELDSSSRIFIAGSEELWYAAY